MNLRGHSFFGNVQHVPGMGFVQLGAPGAPSGGGPLGDDAAVMMISGIGGGGRLGADVATSAEVDTPTGSDTIITTFNLGGLLTSTVDVAGIKVPVWLFMLVAAGAIGFAGWYFFFRKK